MDRRTLRSTVWLLCAGLSVAPGARAQWAVVDAPAIVQLIQEVQSMEQEVETARAQLLQAKQALQTMTGDRGMESLLSGTNRNYLPASWPQVTASLSGSGALSSNVQSTVQANAVLSPQQVAALSPADQRLLQASRQWNAMQQAVAHDALAAASSRFTSLQNLIDAIPNATDQKGALDLQARISAELGMLQNEQIKLQVFNQSLQAQQSALELQAREQAVSDQGNFASRFQPTP